ncbi:MAG: Asp23/Gls24 family envelope stress response protein [Bacillota bacterium]|nr:Asp23/Gls24 family envelope stress response protein [Bacillota bacterium]NLH86834.1 Asp23/Gls24 family envelope stress response protein [Bacillota bacterium]
MELVEGPGMGSVKIANEVVAVIAGLATIEVEGIAGMSGGIAEGWSELWGKKNLTRGVKVEVGEEQAAVDLNVVVKFGAVIPEVCEEVQRNVKRTIEIMTGLEVVQVNVHVTNVFIEEKETSTDVRVR